MKVLNFLPEDFLERRSRFRANIFCAIVGAGSLLAMGGVFAFVFISMLGTAQMRSLVDQQYQEAVSQIDQLKKLEDHRSGLLRKVELSMSLLDRVPRSHLLARLVNYLPQQTSLMMVLMKVEEVEVKGAEAARAAAAAKTAAAADAKTSAGGADDPSKSNTAKQTGGRRGKGDTVKVKQCVFRVDGLAPTDVQVAEYLSRLSSDPIFRDVDLQFSEEFPQREGVTMRRFQLSFRLSPEAEKVLDSATPEAADLTCASPAPSLAKGKP
jgi:Tfp pilus assembly protein PilN